MQSQISDAKNKLRAADDYRQLVGSYFEQTVADVYEQYERELHRMNAMDFDDLLVRSVNLLELFHAEGVALRDLSLKSATLEQVFLQLTGRELRE